MPTILWIGTIFVAIADIIEMVDEVKQKNTRLIEIQEKYENKIKRSIRRVNCEIAT